jgi:hypothetical protein
MKRRSIKDDCISDSEFPPRKMVCAQRRSTCVIVIAILWLALRSAASPLR